MHLSYGIGFNLATPQREVTRIRMAQTLRGDLTSQQEADLMDLLAEKVSGVTCGEWRVNSDTYTSCVESAAKMQLLSVKA